MEYCDLVYMCTTVENLNRLQLIQNCACRIILQADITTSTATMHQQLELPTLAQRRTIHLAMECHNNIYNVEAGLHKMFVQVDVSRIRDTRSTNTNYMKVKNVKSVTGRKAFEYRGPNFWNKLDSDSRKITSKPIFKNHISKLVCRDVNHPG